MNLIFNVRSLMMLAACLVVSTFNLQAQAVGDNSINKTDSLGRKQGRWEETEQRTENYFTGKDTTVVIKLQGVYKDGKREGHWKSYFAGSMVLESESIYVKGRPDSLEIHYFPNGNRKMYSSASHDALSATKIAYNTDGKVMMSLELKDGKTTGTAYYLTGEKFRHWEHVADKPWTMYYYYENGNLKEEVTYKDVIENGIHKGFYNNGNLEFSYTKVDGKMEGTYTTYYENGTVKETINYEKGIPVNGGSK